MTKIALNTSERILLKVPTFSGWEWRDPQLIKGATYEDVATAATEHEASEIIRFDESTLHGEEIAETVAMFFHGDVENPPAWLRSTSIFGTILAEERRVNRQLSRHERSFAHVAL